MRKVFIESNFILELAFQQREFSDCEKLMQAAEDGEIELVVPVYCLTEVFQTLGHRRQQREKADQLIQQELKQHLREKEVVTADVENLSLSLRELLLARTERQTANLFSTTARLTQLAQVLPLTTEMLLVAQQAQLRHSLTPQDALVFASVYQYLPEEETEGHLFISRNEDDFKKADLLAELRNRNCDYLSSFKAAIGKLRL